MNTAKLGRGLLFGLNVAAAVHGLLADWNRAPVFDRRSPPHPKFSGNLTISLGVLLGGFGVYALRRQRCDPDDNVRLAALCPAMFFTAMASAQAYRGADTFGNAFAGERRKVGCFSFEEAPFAVTMLLLTAAAWKLARPTIRVHAVAPESADIVPMPAGA